MKKLKEQKELREYYSDTQISNKYIDCRFQSALGRVLHEKQVGVVNHVIKEFQCDRIIELACGPARITSDITGGCYRVAVDGSPSMIKEGIIRLKKQGKEGQWSLHVADIFDMALNEQFDLVYSFRFIRHFKLEDRKRIYSKIEQHLRTGGKIVFDVVNRRVSEPERLRDGLEKYPIYDKLYYEDDFREEMEKQNWQIVQLIPVHPHYRLIGNLQVYLAPRSYPIAYYLIRWIEHHLRAKPLEWIAVCKCG